MAFASICLLVALCLGKHKNYRNPHLRAVMRARRADPTMYYNQPPLSEESVDDQIRFHQMEIQRLALQRRQEPLSSGNGIISY